MDTTVARRKSLQKERSKYSKYHMLNIRIWLQIRMKSLILMSKRWQIFMRFKTKPVYNKIKATRNEIDALLNREDIEIKIGILRAKKIPKTLGLF